MGCIRFIGHVIYSLVVLFSGRNNFICETILRWEKEEIEYREKKHISIYSEV